MDPVIGHLKVEGKLGRCFLKGTQGDALNALLAACGQNLRWLLRRLYFALKKVRQMALSYPAELIRFLLGEHRGRYSLVIVV